MIKYTKQLNKIVAVLMLTIIALTIGFNSAKANIFEWFSDSNSNASTNQVFNFVTSYLNVNSQLSDNGQENSENLPIIQSNSLISASSPIIIKKPTKLTQVENIANQIIKELIVSATAYSSTPDQTDGTPFITALGTSVRDGIIATNFLPFGTKIKIPDIYGDKIFVVEDRMNRRYWHRVDIWFPDRASALEFGFKKVKIQILES